jgi:hypothetical protein
LTDYDAFARGLTKRFMNEIDLLDSLAVLFKAVSKVDSAKSKGRWIKEIRNLESALGPMLLASHMIGTERKPVWVGTAMGKGKTSVYDHNENVLEVFTFSIPLGISSNRDTIGSFAEISEHAILRIIQRSGQARSYRYDPVAILDEFRSAINLSSLFEMLTYNAKITRAIYPKIPAKNGLFRAQIYRKSGSIISLRTYLPYALYPRESGSGIEIISHLFAGHEDIPFFAAKVVDSGYRGALFLTAYAFLCRARPMLATLANLFAIGPDGAHDAEIEEHIYAHFLARSNRSICSNIDRIHDITGSWDRFFKVACRLVRARR